MAEKRTLLLIADIGGYTRFMKLHRLALAHAQEIVRRLLESIIEAAEPAFTVAKLEGDAVFLYAVLPDAASTSPAKLTERVRVMEHAFAARQGLFNLDRVCTCEACMQVGQLKIKFVAHLGEVAFQKVSRFSELAGMDVIVVHRLLKNSVPVPQYVLMTEPVAEHLDAQLKTFARPHQEELEGVGPTQLEYIDLKEMAHLELPVVPPSFWRRWSTIMSMNLKGLPNLLGLKKACEGFKHIETATGALAVEAGPVVGG